MPRALLEVSPIPSPRPPESARRHDYAPEQPFDRLLDIGTPGPEPRSTRERQAPERSHQAANRGDTSPTGRPKADSAMRPNRSTQSGEAQKRTPDTSTTQNSDQTQQTANPKDAAANAENAPATDAAQNSDTTEADARAAPIGALLPAPPQSDTSVPLVAAPAATNGPELENTEADPEITVLAPAAAEPQTPAAIAAAANAPVSDTGAHAANAQGAVAQQVVAKTTPGKTDAEARDKPSAPPAPDKPAHDKLAHDRQVQDRPAQGQPIAGQPAHGQPGRGENDAAAGKSDTPFPIPAAGADTAATRTGITPDDLPRDPDVLSNLNQNPQHAIKAQSDQPHSRIADPKQFLLPPDASQRAQDALEAAKPAVEPVPNFNPAAPGAAVAANHAAVASAIARADNTPAPAIPLSGLAVEIAARAQAGRHRFEIRLDPPELGRIDVRLDVDRHGAVTSRLVIERQETFDLLRRDAAQLERALQDAGLKTADNSLQFMLRDQAFNHEQHAQPERDAARIVLPDADPSISDAPVQPYGRWPGFGGGLDIRV